MKDLIPLLDAAAARMEALGPGPHVVAECPHKFNDAAEDDLWLAVQSGSNHWEQSQFYTYTDAPEVRESSRFDADQSAEALRAEARAVASEKLDALRGILRDLQQGGWADLAPGPEALVALIVERGQRYLARETPNVLDGTLYAWDGSDLFEVGGFDRIDQSIGNPSVVSLTSLDPISIDRLSPEARAFYRPQVRDGDAWVQLHRLSQGAAEILRRLEAEPVVLVPHGVSDTADFGGLRGFAPARAHAAGFRPKEGELRKPRRGVWPKYQPFVGRDPTEYSDFAKAVHLILSALEDLGWHDLGRRALGTGAEDPARMALVVGGGEARLFWNHAVWRVGPRGFEWLGLRGLKRLSAVADLLETEAG